MTTNISNSDADADALIQQGLTASQAGRVDEALSLFKQASAFAPASGLPHFLMAAEWAQLGRMEEAETAYATAVLLAPGLEMARYQLGLLQFTSGRIALALVTWGPLFELPPSNPLRHIVNGFAALAGDDFGTAEARFRDGMALNHANEPLNHDLQMLLGRMADALKAASQETAPDAAPTAAAEGPGAESTEESAESGLHVLLANYQHQGRPH